MNIFINATGQDDNIGDVVLRRRMLRDLQALGSCHVYVSDASAGYVEGLQLEKGHHLYASYREWLIACTLASLKGQAIVVHKPGEISATWRGVLLQTTMLPCTIAARLWRHPVARLGVGIKDESSRYWPITKVLMMGDSITTWRDSRSAKFFGRGKTGVDWAFDEYSDPQNLSSESARPYLAVSMRWDRDFPPPAWFSALEAFSDTHNLDIRVVTQVRRDNEVNGRIAAKLGAEHFAWLDRNHQSQEELVRGIYAKSSVVVSDRLHCLIMGVTEGAVPVGTIIGEDIKVGRHFEAARMDGISLDVRHISADGLLLRLESIFARREQIAEQSYKARAMVKATGTLLDPK